MTIIAILLIAVAFIINPALGLIAGAIFMTWLVIKAAFRFIIIPVADWLLGKLEEPSDPITR